MSKVLCRSVIAAAIAAATGALACSDSATRGEAAKPAITEPPSFTAAVDFAPTLLARGNLGNTLLRIGRHREAIEQFEETLKLDPHFASALNSLAWVLATSIIILTRLGRVLVTVTTGTITFYMGDDPNCSPHVHPAGTTFFENGGMVGIARNEGSVEATAVATFFVPAGSPTRLDAPAPGNCAF